eukprot:gene13333-14711_t
MESLEALKNLLRSEIEVVLDLIQNGTHNDLEGSDYLCTHIGRLRNVLVQASWIYDGNGGRPALEIPREQTKLFIGYGFFQVKIAAMFGVSTNTFQRRIAEFALPTKLHDPLSGMELDTRVINTSLLEFTDGWNNHPLSTEGNMSPAQLWLWGSHQTECENTEDLNEIMVQGYGIDWNGPLPNPEWEDTVTGNGIDVADVHMTLPEEACVEYLSRIDVERETKSFGIDIFIEAVDVNYLTSNITVRINFLI